MPCQPLADLSIVMPGLVPAFAKASADWHLSPAKPWRRRVPGIHVLASMKEDVDGRDIGERKRRRPLDDYAPAMTEEA